MYAAVSVLHVGSVSVGVASVRVRGLYGSREKEAPPAPCMVGGPSLSALAVIGTACFFAGQLSSLGRGELSETACSETEVSAQFTLEQDEPRVWWYTDLETLFALAGGLHNKKKKNWGLTHGHDFVVTGSKESLLEIKKQLKNIYPIKVSIIGAGSEKSIKALNRRICWGERERGMLYQHDPRRVDVLVADLGLVKG